MPGKIKFVEINYHHHQEFSTPAEVIAKHQPTNLFLRELVSNLSVTLVKHAAFEGAYTNDTIDYKFFRGKNIFSHIPFTAHRFIRSTGPDVVLVQGLIFPMQVIALRRTLGRHCRILVQHQGEVPFRKKRIFQKLADRMIDGYLFSSRGNAEEWVAAGVIRNRDKCFEIPDASTDFHPASKTICRERVGMGAGMNFLWVGRLMKNKDPLTVLAAFEKYFEKHATARLYMVYQSGDLVGQVQARIAASESLRNNVIMAGEVEHPALRDWYSAADYFISASHREGGGYALREAMACGCIPIVTSIPSSIGAIGNTDFHFDPGDATGLLAILLQLDPDAREEISRSVRKQYENELSAAAKGRKMLSILRQLQTE